MIGIVILNYKNFAVTLRCVDSIFANEPDEDYHVFIVENGSGNESADVLNDRYGECQNITILTLPKNIGFSSGNNRGIELCEKMGITKCILTNSDIVFEKGSIQKLIDDLKDNTVIAGPKIIMNGSLQHSSRIKKGRAIDPLEIGRFFPPKKLDEENGTGIHKVFSVSGCCFAIDIPRFKSMGAFDENVFLYNEENILGMQAIKNKVDILIDLDVKVYHEHGASSGKDNDFVRTEYLKSTLYYWKQYRNKGRFFLNLLITAYIRKLKLLNNDLLHPDSIKAEGKKYLESLYK